MREIGPSLIIKPVTLIIKPSLSSNFTWEGNECSSSKKTNFKKITQNFPTNTNISYTAVSAQAN